MAHTPERLTVKRHPRVLPTLHNPAGEIVAQVPDEYADLFAAAPVMRDALLRAVKHADRIGGDAKYGNIKWGICTRQGYRRWYAEAIAALVLSGANLSEISTVAVEEIRAALSGAAQPEEA